MSSPPKGALNIDSEARLATTYDASERDPLRRSVLGELKDPLISSEDQSGVFVGLTSLPVRPRPLRRAGY